jgi:chitodextrinase
MDWSSRVLPGVVRCTRHTPDGELEGSMSLRRIFPLALAGLLGFAASAQAQTTWHSIALSWTTPGDDSLTGLAAQFDLRYSTSPITVVNFASATRWLGTPTPAAPGTRQSVTVTGLSANTTYYFAIKTADEVPNWSGVSNVISRTTSAAPDTIRPAPLAIRVDAATDSTVTLGWNATGDDSLTGTAASYDIRYSTLPITAGNWATATGVSGAPAPAAPGTAQSHVVRGLSRQVTYYFAIRASDEAGNVSALSNVPSVTTPDTKPPAAIRDLAVGFVWFGWHSAGAIRPGSLGAPRS